MLKTLSNPFKDPTAAIPNPSSNPYVSKLQVGSGAKTYYGESLNYKAGKWRCELGLSNETPLVLEIGCHKGRTLNSLAQDHPEVGFLGMDITYKRVVMSAERALRKNLANVGVMMCNANHIDRVFAPGELSGILIFFPDPWPKSKHSKHRLFSEDFGAKLLTVVKPGGFLWLKTDEPAYFQAMVDVTANLKLEKRETIDLITGRYCTTFEEKFTKLGIPTHEAKYRFPD